jgi:hypothetical protein
MRLSTWSQRHCLRKPFVNFGLARWLPPECGELFRDPEVSSILVKSRTTVLERPRVSSESDSIAPREAALREELNSFASLGVRFEVLEAPPLIGANTRGLSREWYVPSAWEKYCAQQFFQMWRFVLVGLSGMSGAPAKRSLDELSSLGLMSATRRL